MRSVLLRTLYEKRAFMIGWTIGFAAFAALMASFYPAMHQDGALDSLVANMPKAFEGLIGNLANLKDFPSYLASQLFDIRLPLIAGIMAIILGLGLSTSQEESGELRTVTALPISRSKVLFEKWLALVIITFITTIGLVVGIYAVLPFLDNVTLESATVIRLVAMTWLLMVTYGTITFAAGVALGNRGLASGISIFVIVGSFILSTFAQAVDWLEKFEVLSLIHYFPAVDIANNGIRIEDVAVLGATNVIVLFVAWIRFRTRDIA